MSDLFRRQAIDAQALKYSSDIGAITDLLQDAPRLSLPFFIAGSVAVVAILTLVQLPQRIQGVAVITVQGTQSVVSSGTGAIRTILTRVGNRVGKGDPVVQLEASVMSERLSAIDGRWSDAVRAALLIPHGSSLSLAELRSELAIAKAELANQTIRAPFDGLVLSLPVVQGQYVRQGDAIGTVAAPSTAVRLRIVVPGDAMPAVKVGQQVVWEPRTDQGSRLSATVSSVDTSTVAAASIVEPALQVAAKEVGAASVLILEAGVSHSATVGSNAAVNMAGLSGTVLIRTGSTSAVRYLWRGRQ